MRRPRSWAPALAALALALVFALPANVVLSGATVAVSSSASSSSASVLASARAEIAAAPISPWQRAQANVLLDDLGPSGIVRVWSGLDSSQQKAVLAQDPGLTTDGCAFGLLPGNGCNWGIIGAGAVTGCVIGAASTIYGAGIGCIPGAAIGAIGAALAYAYFGDSNSNSGATNPATLLDALAASENNEMNITQNDLSNSLQLFNLTSDYWYRLADSAATLQLANATFSPEVALAQGGVLAQLTTMLAAELAQADEIGQQNLNIYCAYDGIYSMTYVGPIPVGSAASTNFCPTGGVTGSNGYTGPASGGSIGVLDGLGYTTSPTSTDVWADGNSSVVITGPTTCTVASGGRVEFYGPLTIAAPGRSYVNVTNTQGCGEYSTGLPPGLYEIITFTAPSGGTVFLHGFGPSATSGDAARYAYAGSEEGGSMYFAWSFGGSHSTYHYQTLTGSGSWNALVSDITTMEVNAENNAQIYWSYLKELGCNGSPQEAAVCSELPEPWMGIPENLNLGTMTSGQIASMYEAYLNGLSQFFNSTDYRSHSVPPGAGNFTWGDADAYAAGDVYVANTTEYPSENFSKPTTWAVTQATMLLEPEILSLSIPLKQIYVIPKNDPIDVFTQTNATCSTSVGEGNSSCPTVDSLEHLSGYGAAVTGQVLCGPNASKASACSNASGNDCAAHPSDPGCATTPSTECTPANTATLSCSDALYLTSCSDVNAQTGECTITLQTVNWTAANITCNAGTSTTAACPTPNNSTGGAAFSIGDPFTAFANWLSNLLHIPLADADAIVAIIVVAVVLLVAYAVYAALSSGRARRSGGGSGSA
jgi:hypothetical protein